MFVKNTDNGLIFIKSNNIKAFPCGRRRSILIDGDGLENTVSDRYHIPFDPEARLNTESNNRKHSGLNGYKQSYFISWTDDGVLSFVINGYLFKINLATGYKTEQEFGEQFRKLIGSSIDGVYATIKLASVNVFSGFGDHLAGGGGMAAVTTNILRDQTPNIEAAQCLDLFIEGSEMKDSADSYYFSGLSLSTSDLSNGSDTVSLQILSCSGGNNWSICNTSRLPKIDHGGTKESVTIKGDLSLTSASDVNPGNLSISGALSASKAEVTGEVSADSVKTNSFIQKGITVPSMKIVKNSSAGDEQEQAKYQLQFFSVDVV